MFYVMLLAAPLCKAGGTDAPSPVVSEPDAAAPPLAGPEAGGSPVLSAGGVTATEAIHCTSASALLGASSSYSTTLMARRVMEQGEEWTQVAALMAANPDPDTMVATPFTLVEDNAVRILATHLIELIAKENNVGPTLQLAGKQMDVDGTRYVVLTSYRVVHP